MIKLGALWETALNLALPPRCLGCGGHVQQHAALCSACYAPLKFLSGPQCAICAHPFESALPKGTICAACEADSPAYDKVCAVLIYDDACRSLVTRFKYGDQTHHAVLFAKWIWQVAGDAVSEGDLLVPVPLHRWRLLRRRFNQSALLASLLARRCHVPVSHALKRVKNTPPQASLSQKARKRNVSGVFRVKERAKPCLKDKRVILVDDVMTTGSTLDACARQLKRAGAAEVIVCVVAKRVISQ